MPTIREIEDKIIIAIQGTGDFGFVTSLALVSKPIKTVEVSNAFVYFEKDILQGEKTRPVYKNYFIVVVEYFVGKAEIDTYFAIDSLRDSLQGKTLSLTDITPFICDSRTLTGFEEGTIQYTLVFTTNSYYPIPAGWRR